MNTAPSAPIVLAGHGRRIAAALLDGVFYAFTVGAFGVGGFLVGLAVAGSNTDSSSDSWEDLGWILLGSVVGLAIGIIFWLALIVTLVRRRGPRNGQTIGKQLVGIRAWRANGSEISVGWALLREIGAKGLLIGITSVAVSALLGFADGGSIGGLLAIALWYGPALADDQRRGLHDRLCDTRVIVANRGTAPPPPPDDLWPATP